MRTTSSTAVNANLHSQVLAQQYKADRSARAHDSLFMLSMFLLPFSLGEDVVVISYSMPFFLLLTAYYFLKLLREPVRIERSVGLIFFVSCLILTVMAITSFIGDNTLKALSRVAIHANGVAILFYFCSSLSVSSLSLANDRYNRLVKTFIYSGAIMALYYIVNFSVSALQFGVGEVLSQRFMGGHSSLPWGASNGVAAVLLIPLIASLQALAESRPTAKMRADEQGQRMQWTRLVAATVLILAAIALTVSRNAMAVALLMTVFFALRGSRVKTIVAIGVATTILFMVFVDENIAAQLFDERLRDRDEFLSGNTRTYLWESYWNYIKQNPFTPIGYYNSLFAFEYSSHNFSFTTYVEQSIIGWLLAVLLTGLIISRAFKMMRAPVLNARIQGEFAVAGMLLIGLNLHFEDANFSHQYILYFWVYVAIFCFRAAIVQKATNEMRHAGYERQRL